MFGALENIRERVFAYRQYACFQPCHWRSNVITEYASESICVCSCVHVYIRVYTHVWSFFVGVPLTIYVRSEFKSVPFLARTYVRVRVCFYVFRHIIYHSKTCVSSECSRVTTRSRGCVRVCICTFLSDLFLY